MIEKDRLLYAVNLRIHLYLSLNATAVILNESKVHYFCVLANGKQKENTVL